MNTISDVVASNTMSSLKATANTTTSVITALIPTPMSSIATQLTKPKVSFRDRIKSLQHSESKPASSTSNQVVSSPIEKEHKPCAEDKEQLMGGTDKINIGASSSSSLNIKSSKPSAALSLKDKIKQLGHQHVGISSKSEDLVSTQLRPWSKLKLATVLSGASSYASLNNSFTDTSPTHTFQPIKIAKIKPTTSISITTSTIPERDIVATSSSATSLLQKTSGKNRLKVKSGERICISDSEIRNAEWFSRGKPKYKSRTSKGESKIYRSVDDLSPEYGGLPFVKKLKILNERQKLAELESVIQTRSFSLDCPEWNECNEQFDTLIRSHSEGSGMTRSRISTITTIAPTSYMNTTNTIVPIAPLNMPRSPVSPESNETQERRELKSILKKLSEEKGTSLMHKQQLQSQQQQLPQFLQPSSPIEPDELKGLMRSPTVEGYVARHSKFMKSVTFNSTLSSPPNSAHSAIDERSSFPLLSNAQQTPIIDNTLLLSEQQQPPLSPLIQTDNTFLLLGDSTNNKCSSLQEEVPIDQTMMTTAEQQLLQSQTDRICLSPSKIDVDTTTPKISTNPFLSNKLKVKGKYKTFRYSSIFLLCSSFLYFGFPRVYVMRTKLSFFRLFSIT